MRFFPLLLLVTAALAGCGPEDSSTESKPCTVIPLPNDPLERLQASLGRCDDGRGSGRFGRWTRDARGLPAYRYSLDQSVSPLALYTNSYKDERRTHWSGFGNDRVTAWMFNHGAVEVLAADKGILSLNKHDRKNGRWGGGIGVVLGAGEPWSTLAWDTGLTRERLFAMDGGVVAAQQSRMRVEHRTYAPVGDAPVLVAEVILTNRSGETRTLDYLESWDLNPEQRFFGLVSTGLDRERAEFQGNFAVNANWYPKAKRVEARYTSLSGDIKPPTERVYEMPVVFLADPDGAATAGYTNHDAVRIDAQGRVNVSLQAAKKTVLASAENAPTALTLRWKITLGPFESRTVRAVFGYRYADADLPDIDDLVAAAGETSWRRNGEQKLAQGVAFASDEAPWLGREFPWHAAMLEANSMYDQYHGAHVFNQGSAYGYLQGINGAPRDIVLSLVPSVYVRPDLAKENLRYIMRTTDEGGRIYYAAIGEGVLTGAAIHENPSDLDLFFMWGLGEYLLATRDFAFLAEPVAYAAQPVTAQSTVRDHARKAYQHLTQTIGIGAHGLIKLRDGDWSDGILLRAEDAGAARERGESTFNAALAAHALPRLAAALSEHDPALAGALAALGAAQALAFEATWQTDWYLRGFGDVNQPIGDSQLFLEPHAFALLAGIVPPERQAKLLAAIAAKLEDPSPIGQLVVYPPDPGNAFLEPGWDVNGGTWHAINGVLTAAYARFDPRRAWRSLVKNSLMNHAEVYPEQWAGIWTGPDSFNAHYAERPGETFWHFATAMIDFPAMNSNQHALPLFGALGGYGVAATEAGLALTPRFTEKPFMLRTAWLGVAGGPVNFAAEVRALFKGGRWISFGIPPKAEGTLKIVAGTVEHQVRVGDEWRVYWNPEKGAVLRVRID